MNIVHRRPLPLRAEPKTSTGKEQLRKIPVENFAQQVMIRRPVIPLVGGRIALPLRADLQQSNSPTTAQARSERKSMNLNSVHFARSITRPGGKNRRSRVGQRAKYTH